MKKRWWWWKKLRINSTVQCRLMHEKVTVWCKKQKLKFLRKQSIFNAPNDFLDASRNSWIPILKLKVFIEEYFLFLFSTFFKSSLKCYLVNFSDGMTSLQYYFSIPYNIVANSIKLPVFIVHEFHLHRINFLLQRKLIKWSISID